MKHVLESLLIKQEVILIGLIQIDRVEIVILYRYKGLVTSITSSMYSFFMEYD